MTDQRFTIDCFFRVRGDLKTITERVDEARKYARDPALIAIRCLEPWGRCRLNV